MPIKTEDIHKAILSLNTFRQYAASPFHERFSFPFLCGTYFAYRKIDVFRIVSIAKAVSDNPRYLDVGCGYGDFLEKIREYLPNAVGIEKNAEIFYACNKPKPWFIEISDAQWEISREYDVIFVGWMEPEVDFRDKVASKSDVIITTLDQGLSLNAEFDGHGFEKVAAWRTPSWDDVNTEIMNKYYTKMSDVMRQELSKLRTAHNLWYVYSRSSQYDIVKSALLKSARQEIIDYSNEYYDFEEVLDECGFKFCEELVVSNSEMQSGTRLWEIMFTG
jgi:SAM-dependent methyltransferase